jgi:transposase
LPPRECGTSADASSRQQSKAAALLGVPRKTLYTWLREMEGGLTMKVPAFHGQGHTSPVA